MRVKCTAGTLATGCNTCRKDNYHTGYPDVNATTYQTQVSAVHDALEAAVQRQLMSDVPLRRVVVRRAGLFRHPAIAKKYAGKTY